MRGRKLACSIFALFIGLIFMSNLAAAASVSFTGQTPADNSSVNANSTYVNVSSSYSGGTHYALLDWNNSLVGWWRLEQGNGTLFIDETGRNNGTCGAGSCPTFNSSGIFNGSYQFDGVSQYVTMGDRADFKITNQNFSYCFWANIRSSTAANFYPAGKGAASSYAPYVFWFAASGNAVKMLVGASGCGTWLQSTSMSSTWAPDVWQHWCFVKSGAVTYMYRNSTQVGTYTMTSDSICDNTVPFEIGAGAGTGFVNSTIDETVFFRRALNAQEIKALYNASASQYYNNFTNLSLGSYSFRAYAVDAAGNKNSTETRTVNIANGAILSATLSLPIGGYTTSTSDSVNITFQCNSTDNSGLANISLYITDSSNQSFALNKTTNITGTSNSTSWAVILPVGNYTWNCRAGNSAGNYTFAPANRTIRIDYSPDMVYPIFSNYWDNNATLTGSGRALFNVTVQNANGTVYLNINGQAIRATNLSASVYNASYDLSSAGNYVYNWTAYGNGTMKNLNGTASFYYIVHSISIANFYQYPLNVLPGQKVYSYCTANSTRNASSQLTNAISYKNNASSSWQSANSTYLPRRIVWSIGDSITKGSPNYNPSLPAGPSNPVNSSYQYWLDYYMNSNASGLDGSGISVYNKGAGSDTCLGMAGRFNSSVGNDSIVILMCGINDFSLGRNYTQAEDSVRVIYAEAVAKNDSLIILEVIPDSNGMFCGNLTPFNAWLNSNFSGNPNVTVVATHAIMSNGNYCYYNSSLYVDGVHPNIPGHQVISKAIQNALNGQYYESWAANITIPSGENSSSYDFGCNVSDGVASAYSANYKSVNITSIPSIAILSPANSNNNRTILVNISSSGSYIWFTNASGQNESYTTPVYRVWNEGSNTIYAYTNDSAGNVNSTSTTFNVNTAFPSVSIVSTTTELSW